MASAESHTDLERLADAQAALRRVATLVARESSPEEIFRAVTEEAARVLCTGAAWLLRFETDEIATLVAQSDTPWDPPPLGTRLTLDGDNVVARVFRTGEAAREDDWSNATGPVAAMAEVLGVRSCVATPVVVEGRTWGTLIAATDQIEPLPPDTESRIREFTELVATAIANAEARSQLSRLADAQAALRRVATLVAMESSLADVVAGVAGEVANALGEVDWALVRDDGDGTASVLAASDTNPASPGDRVPIDTGSAYGRAIIEQRPDRIDYSRSGREDFARVAREHGIHEAVSCPIVVRGRAWGAMSVGWRQQRPFPQETESVIAQFGDLVATAVANAEARAHVERLADEQAALRRVATLVAQGGTPEGVFPAVAAEVSVLFGGDVSAIVRFEDDGTATVLGDVGGPHNTGKRVTLDPGYVVHTVRETSRSARFDTEDPSTATASSLVRTIGIRSAVASPIIVEGHLWGAITAAALSGPLAFNAEQRLTEFTELLATAVANTQARNEVTLLAQEQAALRRVATLVAKGVPAPDIFSAVSSEVERMFGLDREPSAAATVVRFDPDSECVLVGAARQILETPLGMRWQPHDLFVSTRVLRSGRPSRVEAHEFDSMEGPDADKLRRQGYLSQVGSPIVVDGRLWGAMTLSARETLPASTEARLEKFTDLVATAIANAEARAELTASRARIVAASDDARRRIERDLHDGAQQRLVSLGLELRVAAESVPSELPELDTRLGFVADEIDGVIDDLREMSRGIHPAVLSDGGLGPALEMLALRATVPVELDVAPRIRYAEQVEVAGYYVVSEALTNTAKHANASRARVLVEERNGHVCLSIEDDGEGGAELGAGSGLTGLRDRVEALGGSFGLSSPPGQGTLIAVELPVTSDGEPTNAR
jgi:signal transduction histidine kinase